MSLYEIKRSSTGIYHLGSVGGMTSLCNGRSGRFRSVSVEQALKASESSFCKKCFGANPIATITNLRSKGKI